jgi:hypothetical protein
MSIEGGMMARIMEAAGVRSKSSNGRAKAAGAPRPRLEQTFPITQRLWVDAEVEGTTVQGFAIAGAIATGAEEETAYLVVTTDSAPIWVFSHELRNSVLERASD